MGRAWQGVGPAVGCPAQQLEELGPAESPSRKVPTQHPLQFPNILSPVPSSRRRTRQEPCSNFTEERIKPQGGEVTHSRPQGRSQHWRPNAGLCPLQPTSSRASLVTWERKDYTSLGPHGSCPFLHANTLTSVWWSVPFLICYN